MSNCIYDRYDIRILTPIRPGTVAPIGEGEWLFTVIDSKGNKRMLHSKEKSAAKVKAQMRAYVHDVNLAGQMIGNWKIIPYWKEMRNE